MDTLTGKESLSTKMKNEDKNIIVALMTIIVGVSIGINNCKDVEFDFFKSPVIECEEENFKRSVKKCVSSGKVYNHDSVGEHRDRCETWAASRYCWEVDEDRKLPQLTKLKSEKK